MSISDVDAASFRDAPRGKEENSKHASDIVCVVPVPKHIAFSGGTAGVLGSVGDTKVASATSETAQTSPGTLHMQPTSRFASHLKASLPGTLYEPGDPVEG